MLENKGWFDYAILGLISPNLGGRNYIEIMILKDIQTESIGIL